MILTEQEIIEAVGFRPAQIAAYRRVESAVLAKLKAQEPDVWQIRNGLCHAGIRGNQQDAVLTAANMQKCHDLGGSLAAFNVRPLYAHPDPRVAELEAVLRECREALVPYMKYVDGTNVLNHPAQCVAKIDEVLNVHDISRTA